MTNDPSKSGTFCSAPWSQIHALPNGDVVPCCMWDYGKYKTGGIFGNIQEHDNLLELLNTDYFRRLRVDLMNGNKPIGCHRCYTHEDHVGQKNTSFRSVMNSPKIFTDEVRQNVQATQSDGSIPQLSISYLDVRFGNICNLRCRMCGHHLSSTWYDELIQTAEIQGGPIPDQKFVHVDCYDLIEPLLETVSEIYFAGGEPALYKEHLKILDRLIEVGNTDVRLRYNTNMSTLKYKNVPFIDVWKQFSNVEVGASIDDQGDIVEYIRTGVNWQRILSNMACIKQQVPHVRLVVTPTIGILNVETFPAFHKFALKNGWLADGGGYVTFVDWPAYLNIQNLPVSYRRHVLDIYYEYKDWLKQNVNKYDVFNTDDTIDAINQIISRLEVGCNPEQCQQHMTSLKTHLELWNQTTPNIWTTSLPHIKRMFEKHV